MTEWSTAVILISVLVMAAAVTGLCLTCWRMVMKAQAALVNMEADYKQLSKQAVQVLEQVSLTLETVQRPLAAGEFIASHVQEVVQAASRTAEAMSAVSQTAAKAAVEHLERARLDNERTMGEVFRWVDAGMTFWHAWNQRSPKSGGGRAE
ncbi:DUF948 domain-containing protein [Paenibacillus lemnae]|uniref:DUF948 domain-containing protein n=1 Tax=Paenibacillus lemnae TaxID=1330551 RepID=A0A848M5N2_PAELE|nr:DUF948 domain-containing protein [Paenibacillus lemnae]NMO95412.1 DUF948 domain-containing protein [Paenibacillus lemnae]